MGSKDPAQMDGSEEPRQGACEDDGAPDSWELADLEESMKKLLAPSVTRLDVEQEEFCLLDKPRILAVSLAEHSLATEKGVEEMDTFLREALQNPRDRLTILRLEQEVEKFVRNPNLQQLEFQPMPSSYLRLAAHRVAQHYHLQSVVVDSHTLEGTRIIARKTLESRLPALRLADIPVDSGQEDDPISIPTMKVAIKQRPQKGPRSIGNFNGSGNMAVGLNKSKSVEERKEEYNKARARIFNSGDLSSKVIEGDCGDLEGSENRESFSISTVKFEDKSISGEACELVVQDGVTDGIDRFLNGVNGKTERDLPFRYKGNSNKVAIFRDREKDRRDPDYSRSYDRYTQRFDPGFGLNLGRLSMHAMYTPVSNYNTEFPHLGGPIRPQIHVESSRTAAAHVRGPWVGSSNSLSYEPSDSVMGPFNLGRVAPISGSAMYLHPHQFTCPMQTMTYVHPQEGFQQSLPQPHLHPEASFSQARHR